jgi:hypothetical protein
MFDLDIGNHRFKYLCCGFKGISKEGPMFTAIAGFDDEDYVTQFVSNFEKGEIPVFEYSPEEDTYHQTKDFEVV